jgi:cyclopropane-fatty-acyl-phospholipid synthase
LASLNKIRRICEKLNLHAGDSFIEIGTGWGGFACYAAEHYGCKVTTTTISQEQYNMAVERVKLHGLEDRVTVLLQDYRLLEGQFDKLVSIEMIEAVGHEYYAEYFAKCSSLIKPEGKMVIQSILVSDQRYDVARKNTDFIKRYIFPGGCLPSHKVIAGHVANHTDLQIMQIDDITYDYAKTLAAWRERFMQKLPQVRLQGFSEEFIRLWEFYLCYCQAGFMERTIHTAQIVFAKPGWRDARYPHE